MEQEKEISAGRILAELAAIGFACPKDYMTVEGGELVVRDWTQLAPGQLAAVASLEKSAGSLKLKLYDKMKALELMSKLLGFFDGGCVPREETDLLQAILQATGQEVKVHDIPELQQAAASGHDLVEQAGP